MKALVLLALALFLISAPAPDAATIGEASAQFIVVDGDGPLFASDEKIEKSVEPATEVLETESIEDREPTETRD